MTKQDIYILNRILGGGQIYGIPDFASMHISELLIDVYKEGMIQRGLLKDKDNLTLEGARIVSYMKEYKESNRYISFNNLTITNNNNDVRVSLMYNPFYDEYKFSRFRMVDNYEEVLDSYSFFESVEDCENTIVEDMDYIAFEKKYGKIKDNVLHMVRYEEGIESSYVIFVRDGKAYLYDEEEKSLSIVGRYEIIDRIKGGSNNGGQDNI